ncbi:MAG TPA: phage tail sheath C-terminal domain-containing protein [Candidatus Binatia bacterium]|nr:phage tail sheath C-terminal domain-containing protein [Candidatus Binatia bacterium]
MPVTPTFPGVYIEEIPSGVRTITGVATSVAAFVDYFRRGPMNRAVQVLSFSDVERELGGLDSLSEASYGLQQFFLNGGTEAWVVRVASGAPAAARIEIKSGVGGPDPVVLTVLAANEGQWGNRLRVSVDHSPADPNLFNLAVSEVETAAGRAVVRAQESYRGLSTQAVLPGGQPNPSYVETVVNGASRLVAVDHTGDRPAPSGTISGPIALPLAGPAAREVAVTFTPGPAAITAPIGRLDAPGLTIEDVAQRLEGAIRSANPTDAAWAQASVRAVGNRLQIAAGPAAPSTLVSFAASAADAATVNDLGLAGGVASANVAQYQGGSIVASAAQGTGVPGADGAPPDAGALIGSNAVDPPTGMFALDKTPIFNLLCLPRVARVSGVAHAFAAGQVDAVVAAATAYCEGRRAFLILDAPTDRTTPAQIRTWIGEHAILRHRNVAFYFPRVQVADPLNEFRPASFGASGVLAGLYARTDAARGVWKAPAGTDAQLRGVQRLDYRMTDGENGTLNPLAVNALRTFEASGHVSWGARTLDGNDDRASEWKYIPVRRLALFVEESLYRGTQWVVFEPNDEPLWAQIRLNVSAFMQNLFRQGAFQGRTPQEAYLVKCDRETTTQNDINLGVVNVLVGFAPLKPAEFVIIRIQQLAGQIQA